MALRAGTAAQAAQPEFPPPPQSGIYKFRAGNATYKPVKKDADLPEEQQVKMLRFQCRLTQDLAGNTIEPCFANFQMFDVPESRATEAAVLTSYTPGRQAVKARNLLIGFCGMTEEAVEEKALRGEPFDVQHEQFKDAEGWARIRVFQGKDLDGNVVPQAEVQRFLTEAEVAEEQQKAGGVLKPKSAAAAPAQKAAARPAPAAAPAAKAAAKPTGAAPAAAPATKAAAKPAPAAAPAAATKAAAKPAPAAQAAPPPALEEVEEEPEEGGDGGGELEEDTAGAEADAEAAAAEDADDQQEMIPNQAAAAVTPPRRART